MNAWLIRAGLAGLSALLALGVGCGGGREAPDTSSIAAIHRQMEDGSLSAERLVRHYLRRIERFDGEINSVALVNPRALAEARALDAAFAERGLTGPLHGIPVLLKDNIDTGDGMPNTAGSWALADNLPPDDAFLVARLRAAGAIILGKANLSEWANFRSTMSSSGWSGIHGQTRNPHDLSASPCGSSSGSGASVAADFAVLAVGTETDGSIVCPSAVNGIVGIKPTLGTVSRDGIIPLAHSQDTAGPMARNLADAVAMLAAMAAADPADPAAQTPPADYTSHLRTYGLRGKRIGVVRNLTGYHPGLDAVFEQALQTLRERGAVLVDPADIDTVGQWGAAEFTVLLTEFKHDMARYLAGTAPGLPKSLAELIAFNDADSAREMPHFGQELFIQAQERGGLDDDEYRQALADSRRLAGAEGIDATIRRHRLDLLVAPTTGPAWKIDHVNGDHFSGSASSAAAISGYPHITVPMGMVRGLPVGLSFFAGARTEGTLIEAAWDFEQATGHRRAPPLR